MVKVFVIIKIHKKLYMVNSKMDNFKDQDNYISIVVIITQDNLNLIRKMEEDYINGQENNLIYMKDNL